MNNTIHPLDFALAIVIATIDSALWLINELAGFHAQPTPATQSTVTTTPAPAQPTPRAATTRLHARMVADLQSRQTLLQGLTKRQLQTLTGIKSSKYNKADLLRIATENLTHTH